jgi:hypothetical protein
MPGLGLNTLEPNRLGIPQRNKNNTTFFKRRAYDLSSSFRLQGSGMSANEHGSTNASFDGYPAVHGEPWKRYNV